MTRLFAFILCLLAALTILPVLKEVISSVNLQNLPGIKPEEIAIWKLMPLLLLIIVFVVSLVVLIRSERS